MSTASLAAPLTMSWRQLAFLNWRVAPALLQPYVPAGTELDLFEGSAYVSLVGLLYADVRILGVPVPLHDEFEGLNLRFYVRRSVDGGIRRGVVFLRELATLPTVALPPRVLLREPFESRTMTHEHVFDPARGDAVAARVEYRWQQADASWGRVAVEPGEERLPNSSGSEREFVTERYFSYTRQADGGTVEYTAHHRPWEVWKVKHWELAGNLGELAGPAVGAALGGAPTSALLADGAPVALEPPARIA